MSFIIPGIMEQHRQAEAKEGDWLKGLPSGRTRDSVILRIKARHRDLITLGGWPNPEQLAHKSVRFKYRNPGYRALRRPGRSAVSIHV
jgi:hypothetical protein